MRGAVLRPFSCAVLLVSACLLVSVSGCSLGDDADAGQGDDTVTADTTGSSVVGHGGVTLPLPGSAFDYQLGGGYPPPPGVTVVARDRMDGPANAGYDICYVNGFQTQPAESASFAAANPDLVLRVDGEPMVDAGWPDEYVYDTSTDATRSALAAVVAPWIEQCRTDGYDAVEIDNLDSYTRSNGMLSADDNVAMARLFADTAHRAGLAVAQKNTADRAGELRSAGYDFAITESCIEFEECADYTEHYDVVLDIEYTDELGRDSFDRACANTDPALSVILRDHDLVQPGDEGYVFDRCPSS
ncbi:endo alpha-1,4 polygalactosaminidase [Rhodococcus kroppenstedtii]|uniref:endo alpha-1,4 polygalactosaminidase n=1 Tax=Rhodococcoides kroppenstedtii TaxID=293050 RepID=UPI001C9A57B0|nr:endo alpha-1,4 polygalactosaminidase [Rhodococcus kroppenstedtii]MBY6438076.1 endo alpha-1,4 polygalactosaminidase [Rhodococcus kroppenstedtii]